MIVWSGIKSLVLPQKKTNVEANSRNFQRSPAHIETPKTQRALLLHSPRQPYHLTSDYPLPPTKDDTEVLIKSQAIGLNPIDWKAPDFNFGIPSLPFISGREVVGNILKVSRQQSRLRTGDVVIVISTDYRDYRKAAFQEYVVAADFNIARLPASISLESGSIVGVAFVASALALGICMGVNFSGVADGPDLLRIVREIDKSKLSDDIRAECLEGINDHERAKQGDFLIIWGGSSACAHVTAQLAKLVGLRVIIVVDKLKHGLKLSTHGALRPDLLVDSYDSSRAVNIIRAASKCTARFGFDTKGKETAAELLNTIRPLGSIDLDIKPKCGDISTGTHLPTPPSTPAERELQRSHLVGLTGLPTSKPPVGTAFHNVPIKLFHEVPAVGEAMVLWLERLLNQGLLTPPDVIDVVEGLENVNSGLDRLRRGEVNGGRLVVKLP